jgi:hypothetical protein
MSASGSGTTNEFAQTQPVQGEPEPHVCEGDASPARLIPINPVAHRTYHY